MEIKILLEKIKKWVVSPFQKNLYFFITAVLISYIVDFIYNIVVFSIGFTLLVGMYHFIVCYILTLLIPLFPNILQKVYKGLVLFFLGCLFILHLGCTYCMHIPYSGDVLALIMGTNNGEAGEFIQTYVHYDYWIIVLFSIIFFFILYNRLKKIAITLPKVIRIFFIFILIGSIAFLYFDDKTKRRTQWDVATITQLKEFFSVFHSPVEIQMHDPTLINTKLSKPKNVVLIIGESFSKSHSSLYGYSKETNPRLEKMKSDSTLLVFENVTSPAAGTEISFKYMMGTYGREADSLKWNECQTLIEVINKVGYKSFWFSNQCEVGMWDSGVSKFAHLCDTAIFSNKYSAMKSYDELPHDGVVLDYLIKTENDRDSLNFFVLHLMGSHPGFQYRYPVEFSKFDILDYGNYKEEQRQKMVEYDNSVLYNDFVVCELMNYFKEKEAIVFYFPDHGLDLYDTRDDYCGHALNNDKVSLAIGVQIPFMIYMSPKFKECFPKEELEVRQSVKKTFCTGDMIYTIMDLIGVQFNDNQTVQKYSLLKDF